MAEPASGVRLLLAPNAFKGTFSAARVAAIWQKALAGEPGLETLARPLSDGGDGALEVWEVLLRGTMRLWFVARDPLGEPRRVPVLWRGEDGSGFVESALACGLALLPPEGRDPFRATTFGCGQLLLGLLEMGAGNVTVGLGGSATCDGGMGLGRALGYRFLAEGGGEVETPADLSRLARILPPEARPWERARVRALWDVQSPLLGPAGAVRVFAPQKFPPGTPAGPAELDRLESGLERLAERAVADLGVDLGGRPGTGAAGGLGGALAGFAGASLQSGAHSFLRLAGVPELLAPDSPEQVDGVLTGEGSYDAQSGVGKLAGELAALCAGAGVPLAIVAGKAPADAGEWVLTGAALGGRSETLDERGLGALAVEAARRIARAVESRGGRRGPERHGAHA